ncbi:MAG: DNA primase [Hyphomicrobiaceae bacterium]|nr:DNA primase [Hyphomicrobiaceae bacterium]
MRYPPSLLDEIRGRLPVSQVVARKVALKRKGREFAGLSPFKVEKTPSFFVNDVKGFYHCFATGEHGDIFTFVMKTEGLSFPEAVERLAGEAGVTLPKPDPRQQQDYDERSRLLEVVAASQRYFIGELASARGREARDYLARRGLTAATIERFGLGYAPASRTALKAHLAQLGFTAGEMATSGMLIAGEDIADPYDRFRHRVMFPIGDLKGRTVAFGGRALDKDQPAKYLNSPETPLFHKGSLLFNAAAARAAAHQRRRIVVVEGYMDVIALVQAGIEDAVAPLGTALTEEQLALLWRLAPEPILCFDGDGAGRKAAERAVDVALPGLKPGASLRFAFLPDGLDPDDLVRSDGPAAMEAVLGKARPLAEVLFDRAFARGDWSTPERRAALEQDLRRDVARISDASVRSHYERDVRNRLFEAWRPARKETSARARPRNESSYVSPVQNGGLTRSRSSGAAAGRGASGTPRWSAPAQASSALRASSLVAGTTALVPVREALILRAMINHPWLVEEYAEAISTLEFTAPLAAGLRDGILSAQAGDFPLDRESLRSHLGGSGFDGALASIERSTTHRCDRFADPDADEIEVDTGFRHALTLHESQVGLQRSLRAAEEAWHADGSESALERIREIKLRLAEIGQAQGHGARSSEEEGP